MLLSMLLIPFGGCTSAEAEAACEVRCDTEYRECLSTQWAGDADPETRDRCFCAELECERLDCGIPRAQGPGCPDGGG
jgi:hypothetical protein